MSWLDQTFLTLFATKYIPGGGAGESGTVAWLLEAWEADVHYTQYTSASSVRLIKDDAGTAEDLDFEIMVLDLDGPGHAAAGHTLWPTILGAASQVSPAPNMCYETRSGAHLLWRILPLDCAAEFEGRRLGLVQLVRDAGLEQHTGCKVDQTPDWTRMFRAPRVLREGGIDLRASRIEVLHDSALDTTTLPLVQRQFVNLPRAVHGARPPLLAKDGDWNLRMASRWLAQQPGAVSGQQGHNTTFKIACRLVQRFNLTAEQALELMQEWNAKCEPPWAPKDLMHKITDARRRSNEQQR